MAICGDILHSRVARSNIILLAALGAEVRVVGPSTLMPAGIERFGVGVFTDMKKGLEGADIVMMLRLQRERMEGRSSLRRANITAAMASMSTSSRRPSPMRSSCIPAR